MNTLETEINEEYQHLMSENYDSGILDDYLKFLNCVFERLKIEELELKIKKIKQDLY